MGSDKPTQVEIGQRWHDDDEQDDLGYGERNYTVVGSAGQAWWLNDTTDWWTVRYDDGYESRVPGVMILRDTFLAEAKS